MSGAASGLAQETQGNLIAALTFGSIASATGVAAGGDGSTILAGRTLFTDLPRGGLPMNPPNIPVVYSFIARLLPDRSQFSYKIFLAQGAAIGGIASDANGFAYVTGYMSSIPAKNVIDSPITFHDAGNANGCNSCIFVLKIDPNGKVLYNVALGSGAFSSALTVDRVGNVYIAGGNASAAAGFPTTPNAFQRTGQGGFVLKLNPSGDGLIFSTLLNGSAIGRLAVDASGRAYVAGGASQDLPVTSGAYQTQHPGNPYSEAVPFVARFSTDGSRLEYATFFGGIANYDPINGIAVDAVGEVYLTGNVNSTDFPVTAHAFQTTPGQPYGPTCAFVAKLNASGSALIFSTMFGLVAQSNAIVVDLSGNAFFSGATDQALPAVHSLDPSFPVIGTCPGYQTINFQPVLINYNFCGQGFVAGIDPTGSALIYSTLLTAPYPYPYIPGVDTNVSGALGAYTGNAVANALAWDTSGHLLVAGYGPLKVAELNPSWNSYYGAFLAVLNPLAKPAFATLASVTNSADFSSTTTAALGGSRERGLVSLFCTGLTGIQGTLLPSGYPLPTELAGVTVRVNTTPAPILSISDLGGYQQINFQVPPDSQPLSATAVYIQQNGNTLAITGLSLNYASAGIYTQDGTHALAWHASDYSLITLSNPARPGEVVSFYANGLGPVSPSIPLGVPAPAAPLSASATVPKVLVQKQPATVLFAGAAPGLLGVDQVNIQLPSQLASGDLDLVVTLPGCTSVSQCLRNGGTASSQPAKLPVGN